MRSFEMPLGRDGSWVLEQVPLEIMFLYGYCIALTRDGVAEASTICGQSLALAVGRFLC